MDKSPFRTAKKSRFMFLEMKLRGLVPNFRFHVSVSDLHIPMIGSPIFLQQDRQIDHGNI